MMNKEFQAVTPVAEADWRMNRINRFTRRNLKEEEVYVFSLILCDNDIDRDFERFSTASLEKLAELFVGKTGIFDHNPAGKNQTARIFDAKVVSEGRLNTAGEEYAALKAWAYMVRCPKNEDLILEIEAGIKKEVSVGCAVSKAVCSVCGQEAAAGCAHQKGREYGGRICHHLLENPTDAYEWSFVAVPAQRNAGVTKKYKGEKGRIETVDVNKFLAWKGREITLKEEEIAGLQKEIRELREKSGLGEEYLDGLRREVIKLAAFAQPGLDRSVMEEVSALMDGRQLKAFAEGFREKAGKSAPLFPQLEVTGGSERANDSDYKI